MKGRTYIVVTVLSWALVVLWGAYWARENSRMAATAATFKAQLIDQGATIYAQNCVICHGPLGEGVVGPSLNRDALRGDPENDADTYRFVYDTVSRGRPGSVVTRWQMLPNGELASFSQMPSWSSENGGPLNEQELRAVTYFIMAGNWNDVNLRIPQAKLEGPLPKAEGVPPEVQQQAEQVIRQKLCLTCHTIGQVGGHIGPDLTHVGSWGVDQAFLKEWIKNPPAKQHRAPVWFSNSAGIDPKTGQPSGTRIEYGPTTMPVLGLTDQELEVVTRYLMGLK
ncbi:MAG: c-type cytochrome [Limnochordaceae bacterium]|uniref:C-type cytochrome n=1 Tax=Carboxydichorda subterranea TaxID=3109565 RepID=A0ABZ1BUH0_9FIRM|nr:c-type cytochrome [Limnochorda sp. L945t]MBE3597385.1 c-type cytochrome [Limnochordaceae bacterium]WRP16434.1 c-type cytochrome [Limnochorda sp. L945t]